MRFLFLVIVLLFVSACAQQVLKPVPVIEPTITYEEPPVAECVSLFAVGDMMLGGTAVPTLNEFGYDYPFEKTADLLSAADITVGNLETALTYRGEPFEKKYTFRNSPEKVPKALKRAGFDLVSLANNHSMDYGVEGLQDTLLALNNVDLLSVGAGMNQAQARQSEIIESNGQKIGFLAYSLTFPEEFWAEEGRPGTAFGHAAHVKKDVKNLKDLVDHVVVQFHWGREGTTELRDYQVVLGRGSIDAGASVVLGHHPHILQAIEQYKEGVIYYSLGNFSFGSFSNSVQVGGIANVQLCPKSVERFALQFVDVNNYRVRFRPLPIIASDAVKPFQSLRELSILRKTNLRLVGNEVEGSYE